MNRKQRYGTFAAVTFAATLVASFALVPLADQQAFARPDPGLGFEVDHVMKINLKGVPVTGDAKCNGGSNNIYMYVPTNGHEHVLVDPNQGTNDVIDNCTENIDSSWAMVYLDDPNANYYLTIRQLGPQASDLKFCSQTLYDHTNEEHCILSSVDAHQGKPKFTITGKVFSEAGEEQVWNFEGNSKFRIAQLDVWVATT